MWVALAILLLGMVGAATDDSSDDPPAGAAAAAPSPTRTPSPTAAPAVDLSYDGLVALEAAAHALTLDTRAQATYSASASSSGQSDEGEHMFV